MHRSEEEIGPTHRAYTSSHIIYHCGICRYVSCLFGPRPDGQFGSKAICHQCAPPRYAPSRRGGNIAMASFLAQCLGIFVIHSIPTCLNSNQFGPH